jgi:hypothetical protein
MKIRTMWRVAAVLAVLSSISGCAVYEQPAAAPVAAYPAYPVYPAYPAYGSLGIALGGVWREGPHGHWR